MGLPSRSYGTYCFILLIQVTQIKLIMKLSLIELIYSFGIIVGDLITRDSNLNQGWNDLWWDSNSNLDIGHHYHTM